MPDRKFGFDTLCLHAGHIPDSATGARALPIYQTTSFVFDSADHAASLFNLSDVRQRLFAHLEPDGRGARGARRGAGRRARGARRPPPAWPRRRVALLTLCAHGDHIVASRTLYGGTYTQLAVTFAQFGIEATFVDSDDPANFAPAIRRQHQGASTSRRSAIRSSTSPTSRRIAKIAHDAGVPLVVDNTLASPYLCRPFEHGADIVIHSVTKYLGGHGTTMGGILVESGKFPWDNGRLPADDRAVARLPRRASSSRPSATSASHEGAHGDRCARSAPRCRRMSAFLLLQGIETLHLRMPRHCESALAVAQHLAAHPAVEWVDYPRPAAEPHYDRARRYLPRGAGGILTFGVRGGRRGRRAVHRGRAVPLAPRQRRRRQDAGHPSGVDDAPPAERGRAARGRRVAGDDPAVGGPRVAGRYPLGPRPGARAVAEY